MWPLAALAQQSERVGRIGVLMPNIGPISQSELIAFLAALKGLGWEEGRNLQMDVPWARAMRTKFQSFSKELVSLRPDVIVGMGTPVTRQPEWRHVILSGATVAG